ncbi:hypothetical protein Aperf_G00000130010 [Anoplocephala perfoliata]
MPSITLGDVEIDFPYIPYECQKTYMQSIIDALNQRSHAILESPTGTGKTLCLLCASLAWLEYFLAQQQLKRLEQPWDDVNPKDQPSISAGKFDAPLIVFSSRTHAQLNQAIQAFKTTAYSSHKISVIGSRDQLCLLPEVVNLESNSAKVYQCRLRVSTRTCEYFRNFDAGRDKLIDSMRTSRIADIEDLCKFGQENRACAYYLSREVKSDAEILFMPYNYLLDAKIRTLYGIELTNAVVIFDEAHNIEQVCEDAASATLTSVYLASAIEELRVMGEYIFSLSSSVGTEELDGIENVPGHSSSGKKNQLDISQAANNPAASLSLSHLLTLKGQLIELERLFDGLGEVSSPSGTIKPGEYVFELLGQAGITPDNQAQTQELIDQIIGASISMDIAKFRRGRGLSHVAEFLQKVFSDQTGGNSLSLLSRQHAARCFRVHIKVDLPMAAPTLKEADVWARNPLQIGEGIKNKETKNVCLSYWCLTPGKAMQDLLSLNVRNIILTSGTLYPISSLQAELGLHSALVLQNPHVIKHEQIQVAVLPKAPDGGMLNASFENRGSATYHRSLGLTLVNLFRIIPGGIIVFFPSYALMKNCLQSWQNSDIYGKLVDSKKTFTEPRDKTQFQQITAGYIDAAGVGGGSALFAVVRGKVSEGLDLTDHTSRAVVVVGIAYPPCEDPRIKIKMAFLDEQRFQYQQQPSDTSGSRKVDLPTGRQWYKLQAWRAVNQAVGRVIRHVFDYGIVYLCDERFASTEAKSHLPMWMQSSIRVYNTFGPVVKATAEFFRNAEAKYPSVVKAGSKPPARPSTMTDRSAILARRFSSDEAGMRFPTAAGHIKTYVGSLASTSESDDFLADYSQTTQEDREESGKVPEAIQSSCSLLEQSLLDNRSKHPFPTEATSSTLNSDDIEARLLKRHQASKRIKLVKELFNPVTGDSVTPSDYISSVRALLSRTADANENNMFESFKSALLTYKSAGKESTNVNVERVFTALAGIFLPLEVPGLLRDFIVFVRANDKARYSELCMNITGLAATSKMESAESSSSLGSPSMTGAREAQESSISCSNCKKSPLTDALRADCSHICCFPCWRSIIEEGNRRCPICGVLVRRRNLTRLARNKPTL